MESEIIIFEEKKQVAPIELFTAVNIDKIIETIKQKAKSIVTDVTTEKGRKEIASIAYKVSQSKSSLDRMGKELTEDWARQKSLVDYERKKVREELDSLRDEIRKPLTEYEEREEKRINERKERIQEMENILVNLDDSISLKEAQEKLNILKEFDWQEFNIKATETFDKMNKFYEEKLEITIKREQEKAELERLRKEQEERKIKEREELIAKEASEKARKEAEEKARIEKERIWQEQKKKDEEVLFAKQEAEREARERESKIDAEKKLAEQAKLDAEKRALEAEQRAKESAQKALEEERSRIETQKKQEAEELAKREANKKHKTKIHNEIIEDLSKIAITDADTYYKAIIVSIAKGEIRNLSINY